MRLRVKSRTDRRRAWGGGKGEGRGAGEVRVKEGSWVIEASRCGRGAVPEPVSAVRAAANEGVGGHHRRTQRLRMSYLGSAPEAHAEDIRHDCLVLALVDG